MSWQWRRLLLMTSALAPLTVVSAAAGPNGATVVGGSATVQGQGTANVVVNQTSQSAIINWTTFNIGTGQTTQINMPSASSVELDRVTYLDTPFEDGSLSYRLPRSRCHDIDRLCGRGPRGHL